MVNYLNKNNNKEIRTQKKPVISNNDLVIGRMESMLCQFVIIVQGVGNELNSRIKSYRILH